MGFKVEHYPFAIFLLLKDLCKTRISPLDTWYVDYMVLELSVSKHKIWTLNKDYSNETAVGAQHL